MKHESFDEREIYLEGVLDGLALALDYPENVGMIREHLASVKARVHWGLELKEMMLSLEPWKDLETSETRGTRTKVKT